MEIPNLTDLERIQKAIDFLDNQIDFLNDVNINPDDKEIIEYLVYDLTTPDGSFLWRRYANEMAAANAAAANVAAANVAAANALAAANVAAANAEAANVAAANVAANVANVANFDNNGQIIGGKHKSKRTNKKRKTKHKFK